MPNLEASRPVRKGRTAEPVWPILAMYPIQSVKSQRGRIVVEWFIKIGARSRREELLRKIFNTSYGS